MTTCILFPPDDNRPGWADAADELADRLAAVTGGRATAIAFCRRLIDRLAETDRLANDVIDRWTRPT